MVLSRLDETEVDVALTTLMATCHARFQVLFGVGRKPAGHQAANAEPVGALKHLIDSGRVPYVDMALWGPHQIRMMKSLVLTGSVFNADGSSIRWNFVARRTWKTGLPGGRCSEPHVSFSTPFF